VAKERLTERLKTWLKEPESRGDSNYNNVKRSIIIYLNLILNSKKHTTLSDSNFGFSSNAQIDVTTLETSIKNLIINYENRLTEITVKRREESDSTDIFFDIDASIEETDGLKKIFFLCKLGINRVFEIS